MLSELGIPIASQIETDYQNTPLLVHTSLVTTTTIHPITYHPVDKLILLQKLHGTFRSSFLFIAQFQNVWYFKFSIHSMHRSFRGARNGS